MQSITASLKPLFISIIFATTGCTSPDTVSPSDAEEQFKLGLMHATEKKSRRSQARAIAWYRKAAEQNHAEAQFNLGELIWQSEIKNTNWASEDFEKGFTEAVSWYQKAAEQGHAEAQHTLGLLYINGNMVTQDQAQGVSWLYKAAEQGHVESQIQLGVMYRDGRGVPQDHAQAVSWYRKAAKQGSSTAQVGLSVLYASGIGVSQSHANAYLWLNLAAAQGHPSAEGLRNFQATHLTATEISALQTKASHCFNNNYSLCD